MYNSFIFKKHSQQIEREQEGNKKSKKWTTNYNNNIRPALIQKYSRRINNFVVRLEEDKKELYEYRQETQQKAHQLLKEIYRKQKFLGDPTIKLRDTHDWTSILSTTQRIEKQKNKKMFQAKFGDSSLAFRSIASQSAYNPSKSNQFRSRFKDKEIHSHNMRFSYKSEQFSHNKKQKRQSMTRQNTLTKSEESKDSPIRRANSNQSHIGEQESKSHCHSVFSFSGGNDYRMNDEGEESISNHKQPTHQHTKESNSKSKVYFKQVVDLQQNSKEPTIKKTLHQILVRFGISRIKDVKKQAMVETDNLQSDDF